MLLTLLVPPKFQVVIPREIREAWGVKAGQCMQVMRHQDLLELVAWRKLSAARGSSAGTDLRVECGGDRT